MLYYGTSAMELFLPIKTKAKLIQTFPRLDQNTMVLPHVVEMAANEKNWPKPDSNAEQQEVVKPRNSDSLQQTADMGSHGETTKPDKKICDTLSRLRTRSSKQKTLGVKQQQQGTPTARPRHRHPQPGRFNHRHLRDTSTRNKKKQFDQ